MPGGQDKPMDIFGAAWRDHPDKIRTAWQDVVTDDDVVLVPGDISWAMTLGEAEEDLAYLGSLPGRIIMIRGNHDYWWDGIGKVRRALPPNVSAIQNDHVLLTPEWAVWADPGGMRRQTSRFTLASSCGCKCLWKARLKRVRGTLSSCCIIHR